MRTRPWRGRHIPACADLRAAPRSIQAARAQAENLKATTAREVTAGKSAPDSLLASKVQADGLETGKALPDSATDSAPGRRKESEQEIPLSLRWGVPVGGALVLLTLLGWLLATHRRKEQLRSAESRLSAAHQAAAARRGDRPQEDVTVLPVDAVPPQARG